MGYPKILSNPVFGIIGVVLSLVGLAFAFYTHFNSIEYREIVYAIPPEKSVLIDSSKASDFEIKYKGNVISSDVTAVNLTIWNDGKESIRPTDILDPITITLEKNTPILEAKVIKTTRDIIKFTVDDSQKEEGLLFPSWDILEHEDGASIQIIYSGSVDINIDVTGVIEGKKDIRKFKIITELPKFISILRWITLVLIPIASVRLIVILGKANGSFISKKSSIFLLINFVALFFFYLFLPNIKLNAKIPVHFNQPNQSIEPIVTTPVD